MRSRERRGTGAARQRRVARLRRLVRLRRAVRILQALSVAAAGVLLLASPVLAQTSPSVLVTTVDGPITPIIADQIEEGVDRAARESFGAYLIELDTPGGLDTAMRDIVQAIVGADVPVIVHVSPTGARAASAGAIITMSAHVAAMAPGTTTGAATPVDLQGGEISDKVINDAASYARALAELRGRPVDLAVGMVRDGTSVTASEALDQGFADLVVRGRTGLLAELDGRTVQLDEQRSVTLATAGADVVTQDVSVARRLLTWLADPNLAFIFISLGTLAIIYEVANPGVGFGGIVGVILLLLAFTSLAVLPATAAGILLLVLAAGLFVAELFVPGIGVFAAGGVIALVLAGVFLFRGSIAVDPVVLVPTALVAGGGSILAGRIVWRSRRMQTSTGEAALVGQIGTVRTAEGRSAQAFVSGALWNARADEPLHEGDAVRVVEVEGLELVVVPEDRDEVSR